MKAENDLKSAQANLALASPTIDVESLRRNVELAKSKVENTIIRAPVEGFILKIYRLPGEAINSDPILKMANTKSVIALTEVYETDVYLVRKGQSATVTARALPEPLTGKVISVGQLIGKQNIYSNNPSSPTDVRVVEVIVLLDKQDPANRLLLNLQTQVTIHLDAPVADSRPARTGTR